MNRTADSETKPCSEGESFLSAGAPHSIAPWAVLSVSFSLPTHLLWLIHLATFVWHLWHVHLRHQVPTTFVGDPDHHRPRPIRGGVLRVDYVCHSSDDVRVVRVVLHERNARLRWLYRQSVLMPLSSDVVDVGNRVFDTYPFCEEEQHGVGIGRRDGYGTGGGKGHVWLPTEVVEEILEATWNSTISADERKSLLSAFARADPVLHGLLTRAATRFVILDVTGFNTDDLDLYAALADRAATEAGADVDSQPQLNSYYNIEVPGDDVLAFRADLFKNSDLRIEGLTGAGDQPHRHRNVSDPHRPTWGYVLVKLTNIIPDARSLTLAFSPFSLWLVAKQIVPALLFPTLRFFPSLRSVHFSVFFEVLNFASHSAAPPTVAQVTSLRLTHVPTCECSKRDSRPRRADGHLECCLAATLLECFPNLQHLHLENPVFLKMLYPPASLRTLTLDAPPVQRIEGREPFSSLLEYNLAAAVKRGFMAAPAAADRNEGDSEDRPRRRKIVVRTGAGEPFGWMAAQAACNEAEIELVQAVVYAEPDVRVDSVLELGAVKGSSAGSVLQSPTVLEAAKMTAI